MTDITPAIVAAFRADFTGFADDTKWPDALVTRKLQKADKETGSARWGIYADLSIKQEGMFNYAAHLLVVGKAQDGTTAGGGMPGSMAQVASKTVGDESTTYVTPDSGNSVLSEDGALAATSYGQEFIRLRRRVAAGASATQQASPVPSNRGYIP